MYDRYTLIAPVLPFIAGDKMRSHMIASVAAEHNVSKQTVRNHLCLYLAFMDIAALAPRKQLSAPVIKYKKTPGEKCRFVAEEAKKR